MKKWKSLMKNSYYSSNNYVELPKKLKTTIDKNLQINFNQEKLLNCVWNNGLDRFIIITHKRVIACKKFGKIEQNYFSDLTGVEKQSDLKPNITLLSSNNKTYLFDKSQVPTNDLITNLYLLIDKTWREVKEGKEFIINENNGYNEFSKTTSNKFDVLKNLKPIHYVFICGFTGLLFSILTPTSSDNQTLKSSKSTIEKANKPSKIDLNAIQWTNSFSKKQFLGDWYQIGWYANNNTNGWNNNNFKDGEYFFDGNEEQKKLVLTNNTYQTFDTPFNAENANVLLNYKLNNNNMNVYLKGKTTTQMFNYTLDLSLDNKFLKLNDTSITKIYKRKDF